MNAQEEQFGDERVAEVVSQCKGSSASQIIDHIVTAVKNHVAGTPQSDDITIVVVQRKKQ